jgi:surfactin synthase thioesterase subunit
VSGSPAPRSCRIERATGLDDAGFLKQVERFAGYRHSALADPQMREMLLPILRADVEMHESYRPRHDEPIDVQVTALRGATDDLVSQKDAAGWAGVTSARFRQVELPGGHMYLVESARTVLQLIARVSAEAMAAEV